jgi:ABC-type bacteriocin/lantibiotic exporter with double-glycine peptidase domain
VAGMNQSAITIQDLSFQYPGREGNFIKQFDLDIAAGERFGLFGPNGAGKTTLMCLMTGLLSYTKGSIQESSEINQPDFRLCSAGFFFLSGIVSPG